MRLFSTLAAIGVLTLSPAAFATDGAALYATNCKGCHGADAKADTPAAKAMKVPAIAGHDAAGTLSAVREKDKHKPVSGKLSDEDLQAIADFLAAAK